ncbi:MAG TPA: hypothetical protein VK668_20165 [Mucilaginibacter sp.]|nr:hypothetical protein [Mucilaginibacter sp.]
MKSLLLLICIWTITIIGCQDKSSIIKSDNIKIIELKFYTGNKVFSENISDRQKVQSIVTELNTAKRELSVFKAQYILRIIYSNREEQLIICNGSRIKVNGLTYKLNMPIEKIISRPL